VSFSVPFLSAGAAMLGQQHPDWTPAEVRSRLLLLSAPIQNAAGVHMLWRGRVDLARSVSSD
jgi:hypothetical protein